MAVIKLTEAVVKELVAGPPGAWRDATTKGLLLVVNKRSASLYVQADLWRNRRLLGTRRVLLGRVGDITLREARERAQEVRRDMRRGVDPNAQRRAGSTLLDATREYTEAMARRGRAPRSIADVNYVVQKYLAPLHQWTLQEIGENPREVRALHAKLTERNGVYPANHAMRALRAIYNYEARANYDLPPNPVQRAVEFNRERRREAPFGSDGIAAWWAATERLSPVRRAFCRVGLLTGSRPGAQAVARRENLDLSLGVLHVPEPKGGAERAFDIPLSQYLVQVMRELLTEGDKLCSSSPWLFPSPAAKSGHVVEWKEAGLATGHALRHVYRTIAQEAGVAELDVKLLLNHSLGGDITSRYLSRGRLLQHLREQQEKITQFVLARCQVVPG